MSQDLPALKFASELERKLFAIEEDLVPYDQLQSISESALNDICEDAMTLKERRDQRRRRKGRIKDHKRSRLMKKLWKSKRKDFLKGIRKFSKSMTGKRMHQKIGRNRKQGKYRNISEWYASLSSLLTHLAIQSGYTSTINEEAEAELILESANDILLPVLSLLRENLGSETFNVNEALDACEAGQLIDDLLGISEDLGDDDDSDDDDSDDDDIDGDGDRSPSATGTSVPSEDGGGSVSDMNPLARAAAVEEQEDDLDPIVAELMKADQKLTDQRVEDTNESLVLDPTDMFQMISESFSEGLNFDQFTMISEGMGDPDVDGEHVIAKIRGPAFFPNTVSRNKVEYSLDLWNRTLARPEFVRELEARRIYGTFGHALVINDDALRKGEISHIVNKVWIDQETLIGHGEYLVLNTGPGRNLKTLFGAKSKLRVSTRANGKFLVKRNERGNQVPNPDIFFLRGIDFVHDPGYLDAEPSMA